MNTNSRNLNSVRQFHFPLRNPFRYPRQRHLPRWPKYMQRYCSRYDLFAKWHRHITQVLPVCRWIVYKRFKCPPVFFFSHPRQRKHVSADMIFKYWTRRRKKLKLKLDFLFTRTSLNLAWNRFHNHKQNKIWWSKA